MTTAIEIASQALVSIGCDEMQSFDEGTTDAATASILYPMIRDMLLSCHPWNFATAQFDLNRLSEEPLGDYGYKFQLPADVVRVISVSDEHDRLIRQYRIQGRELLCDADNARLQYIFRPNEETFPPHFVYALFTRLAAEFTIPMTESTTRSEVLDARAGRAEKKAKNVDSQQDTPQSISEFPLWEARGGYQIRPADGET